MANLKFARGTTVPTYRTSGFDDGCVYFNTSNQNIYLRNGTSADSSTVEVFKGTDTTYDLRTMSNRFVTVNRNYASIWGHDKTSDYLQFVNPEGKQIGNMSSYGLGPVLSAMPGGDHVYSTTTFSYGHPNMQSIWVLVNMTQLSSVATETAAHRVYPYSGILTSNSSYRKQLIECKRVEGLGFYGSAVFGSQGGTSTGSASTSGQIGFMELILFYGGSNGIWLNATAVHHSSDGPDVREMTFQTAYTASELNDYYKGYYDTPIVGTNNYLAEDYIMILGYSCI